MHRSFKVADEILLLLPSTSNKLLMTWKSPFHILEVLHSNNKIDMDGVIKVFRANPLKKKFRNTEEPKILNGLLSEKKDFSSISKPNSLSQSDFVSNVEFTTVSPICSNCLGEEENIISCAAVLSEKDEDDLRIPTVVSMKENINDIVLDQDLKANQKQELLFIFHKVMPLWDANPGAYKGDVIHSIPLTTDVPSHRKQYPLPSASLEILEKEVRNMIDLGVIEPSKSPYSAPVVLV